MDLERPQMLSAPAHGLIDSHILHQLAKAMDHRHRNPLAPVRRSNPIAILPFILFELHRI